MLVASFSPSTQRTILKAPDRARSTLKPLSHRPLGCICDELKLKFATSPKLQSNGSLQLMMLVSNLRNSTRQSFADTTLGTNTKIGLIYGGVE